MFNKYTLEKSRISDLLAYAAIKFNESQQICRFLLSTFRIGKHIIKQIRILL